MTQAVRTRVHVDEILIAELQVGLLSEKKKRLKWAINFAQEPLGSLPPGRLGDLRRECTAFYERGFVYKTSASFVELVSDEEMRYTTRICLPSGDHASGSR